MSKNQLACLTIWLCVFAIAGMLLFDKKNDAVLRIKVSDIDESEIRVEINGRPHADIVNPEKNSNNLYIPVKLDELIRDNTIKLSVDKGVISSFKLMSSLGVCKFDILNFDITPTKSVNIPIPKVSNTIATLNLFLLVTALIVASLVVSAICLVRRISADERALRYQQLAAMADAMARRLSSTALQRIYLAMLSLPLLAAALFTVVYLAFFAYGLWHGHAMPSAELYFTLPGIGRLLAGKGHISNFCVGWAIIGFPLSLIVRKGAPQAAPLEAPLLRPMLILTLPMCIAIVLALQGAAVFFAADLQDGYYDDHYDFNALGDFIPCDHNAIGGIIPYYDSRFHYGNCLRYCVTGVMPDYVLMRPFAALLGSAILGLCGGNPLVAIMLRCVFVGVAIWLFVCVVARHYGLWSGIAAIGLAVFFITPYLPTFLTEVLGFAWGCIAVALWLEALHARSLSLELIALGLTGLAMLTRMGSMFLLPLLALYIVGKWKWHSPDEIVHSLPRLCAAVGFVLATLVFANAGAMRLGQGTQTTGANYSYCLAGMSIGGNWWTGYTRYKNELSALSTPAEKCSFLYKKAIANIWEHPTVFLGRLWQGEIEFWRKLPGFLSLSLLFLLPICALLAWSWRQRPVSERRFWLIYWLGLAFSIPFFFFDESWRANIVAYPFMAVFISIAFVTPQKSSTVVLTRSSTLTKSIVLYTVTLLVFMVIAALCPSVFPMRVTTSDLKNSHILLKNGEHLMLGVSNTAGMLVVDEVMPRAPGSVWQISRSDLEKVFQSNYFLRNKQNTTIADFPDTPFAIMSHEKLGLLIGPPSLLLNKEVILWKIAIAPFRVGNRHCRFATSVVPIGINGDK